MYVSSINWTLKGQGTWGAAYAPFLLEKMAMPSQTKLFIKNNLLGLAIIGSYRASWTATHELA
ncbi:MAG: hypothetical protein ACLGGX_07680, partial [Bdellovibrionia bacterium]